MDSIRKKKKEKKKKKRTNKRRYYKKKEKKREDIQKKRKRERERERKREGAGQWDQQCRGSSLDWREPRLVREERFLQPACLLISKVPPDEAVHVPRVDGEVEVEDDEQLPLHQVDVLHGELAPE